MLAAPILTAYIVWLSRVSLRKAAILYIPAVIGFFGIVQLVYYGILDAKRQHPLQTIMIFDLGGISHFSKENQFPVDWSEPESAMLLNSCYQPTQWDIYWRLEPCDFVMRKIEREKGLFGTPAISGAWLAAILHHPIAYLQHRSAFMWNFLAADNLTMWTADVEHPTKKVFADRAAFNALVAAHDVLKPTPFLRAGLLASGLYHRLLFELEAKRPPRSSFRAGCLRIGDDLCAELLCRGRGVRLPLRLLGGAGCHRR